ncbi:hypothetical protein J4573_14555 [Actinomadura barringtoniae]|uniref:Lipoprotein n=1 Tax=Actinomadura barringtoniae TaxID=1427535 RepID=A0A939PDX9_9ACTN|nr:hypothetical protein [Actinomadura barringtoniae]MBO2448323.1 hypothetical protein [Actinomadura barringtoniae]
MTISRRAVPVAAFAAASLALAACGTQHVNSSPTASRSGSPSASPSAPPSPYDENTTRGGGDMAPHQQENNGWKQRAELSANDRRLGNAAAARIRPRLQSLRESGDFSEKSVERILLDLGQPRDRVSAKQIQVTTAGTTQQLVGFWVIVGQRACVYGDLRPTRVLIEVDGPTMEGSCVEPFSH